MIFISSAGGASKSTSRRSSGALGEMGLVENVNSLVPILSLSLISTSMPETTTIPSTAAISSLSALTAPYLLTPTIPSPRALTASPPLTSADQVGNAYLPRSPDQGNLGNTYSKPFQDHHGRRSATFSISKECHILS